MIKEYFSLEIDDGGHLRTLPVILDQYFPDMERLPSFVLNLGNNVISNCNVIASVLLYVCTLTSFYVVQILNLFGDPLLSCLLNINTSNSCFCFCPSVMSNFSFILKLASRMKPLTQVDWETEKECFESFSAALAEFYAVHTPSLPNPSGDGIILYQRLKNKLANTNDKSTETGTHSLYTLSLDPKYSLYVWKESSISVREV